MCFYWKNRSVLVLLTGLFVIMAAAQGHAQRSKDEQKKPEDRKKNYGEVLYMNMCSQNYYNYFNPGDKLDSKGEQQMVNHIRASCQCLYKNLNDVFSRTDILNYVQSRHVSVETASRQYGSTPDQVYEVMSSEDLREDCRHLNDMGTSYEDDS